MVVGKVKTVLTEPRESAYLIRQRIRDAWSGRPRFDHQSVSGASNIPEMTKEVYIDAKLAQTVLEGVAAERSLEVGVGYGKMTPWFLEYTDEHHAIDAEGDLLATAKEMYAQVEFEQCLADDMPYPDNHFDFSITWGVLMHVPPHLIEETANEIMRVTKEDGRVIVSERTSENPDNDRQFGRGVDEYSDLFSPLDLQKTAKRGVDHWREEGYGHTAMVFS